MKVSSELNKVLRAGRAAILRETPVYPQEWVEHLLRGIFIVFMSLVFCWIMAICSI